MAIEAINKLTLTLSPHMVFLNKDSDRGFSKKQTITQQHREHFNYCR